VRIQTRSAQEMEALGARLGSCAPRDPAPLSVLYLTGELGSGKTTLARGFLSAFGVGTVRSPTFTLVELHAADSVTVVHADLYRLRDAAELESLGLREWAAPGHLWLIEWPEKGGIRLPPADLRLGFRVGAGVHEVEIQPATPLGAAWLARLATPGS
jgi:tRNA threonylcarbamoyladenosine biosynthesis protein TsaE